MADTKGVDVLAGEEARLMFEPKGMHPAVPATTRTSGVGPFKRLVLRGAIILLIVLLPGTMRSTAMASLSRQD